MNILALIALVRSLFTPTTDKVLSGFAKTVAKLEKVAAHHTTRALDAREEIVRLHSRIEEKNVVVTDAYLEADRATAVASKLQDLFGIK